MIIFCINGICHKPAKLQSYSPDSLIYNFVSKLFFNPPELPLSHLTSPATESQLTTVAPPVVLRPSCLDVVLDGNGRRSGSGDAGVLLGVGTGVLFSLNPHWGPMLVLSVLPAKSHGYYTSDNCRI